MRYIDFDKPGAPEVMVIREGEKPVPKPGEVLIKVVASGVNRPDVVQRQGFYPPPPDASPILGLEVAGEIVAVADDVEKSWIGKQVCALTNGGGYAEFAVAPIGQCLPVPNNISVKEAAALPETFFTVWTNVFDRAHLKKEEVILIHGGSSGIGSAAIQMAKWAGATVIATAGSDEKCQYCQSLGADLAINYKTTDYVKAVAEFTENSGANVILDMVGGEYIAKNIQAAAVEGRIVNIAFLQGSQVELNFMPLMLKRLTLTGSTLRPRSANDKAAIAQCLLKNIWPAVESGNIKPYIAAEFSLENATKAHELMESSSHMGKILLIP